MDQVKKQIRIVCKNKNVVVFDSQIEQLCDYIKDAPDKNGDIICENLEENSLDFMKRFCEIHNYQKDSMKWIFPFTSTTLKNHIDEKSYQIFSQFDNPKDIREHAQKLVPILEVGFYLHFKEFRKIANVALQVPLYCGSSDEEIKNYKQTWGITDEELSAENQRKIMDENKPVFDSIRKRYLDQIEQIKKQEENQQ